MRKVGVRRKLVRCEQLVRVRIGGEFECVATNVKECDFSARADRWLSALLNSLAQFPVPSSSSSVMAPSAAATPKRQGTPVSTAPLPPRPVTSLREFSAPPEVDSFYSKYQPGVPIAIDFGSSYVRAGVTNGPEPNNTFPNVLARYRDRKGAVNLTLVGHDVYRDASIKSSIRPSYDGTFISNWDNVETVLDYTFEHLGVTSNNNRVDNPIIMTEPLANTLYHRKGMYELLFEAYGVPQVAFGIDSLFSFYANCKGPALGLVIGANNILTHVIPVLEGRGILQQAKRIDYGGDQAGQYLQKLLALKYPYFPARLTNQNYATMLTDHCYFLKDYQLEISSYLDMENLEKTDVILQAPVEIAPVEKKKSEEEIARQAERKREQGRRLQEQARQKRLEKLVQKEKELEYYTQLKAELGTMTPKQAQSRLVEDEFSSMADFNKYVAGLEKTLKKSRSQDVGDAEEDVDPAASFPLVDVPDEELNDEQIKEKRKQKLLKGHMDARLRAQEEKRQEEELAIQREKEQEEWRARDLEGWCATVREQWNEVVGRIRHRTKMMESFKDRKSMAAQKRMKNIATLAQDPDAGSKRRRRNVNSATIDNDPNDTFGANDDDWAVYRDISNSALQEEQEADHEELLRIEQQLLDYDPSFHHEDTFAASQTFDWRNSALHKFLHGPRENITVKLQAEGTEPEDLHSHPEILKKNHQLHLNVERIRVPEVLFQPYMAGLDQAGIPELVEDLVVRRMDGNFAVGGQSRNLCGNVFVTGGWVQMPNFTDRLHSELRQFLPVDVPLKVWSAADYMRDPWRGMKLWSQSDESKKSYVSKAEYDEYGPEYIKEHGLGNVCLM